MNNQQIQEMLTVEGWGHWLRYVKLHNVKNVGGQWPNSEFHDFYVSLDLKETEGEATCERGSDSKRDKSVVPTDVPEGHGIGDSVGVHADNHLPHRWEAQIRQLSLPAPSNGPEGVGPSTHPEGGVSEGSEGCLGS